ncbi:MAG: M12 family metallo-peptidase, partial [Holophagales bacterium]|nr:M12 family metallo-peptidase [Holophagales bacterium]
MWSRFPHESSSRALRATAALLPAAFLIFVAFFAAAYPAHASGDGLWTDLPAASLRGPDKADPSPVRFRALELDLALLEDRLAGAPAEAPTEVLDPRALEAKVAAGHVADTVLELPLPLGGFGRFRIVESPIMAPELAAKFPGIRTYRGIGLDEPAATARLDLTPAGFHAMVLSPRGDVYIDPYGGDGDGPTRYLSYLARDARRSGEAFRCHLDSHRIPGAPLRDARPRAEAKALSGSTLRTYRLAVAATGEYTAFHGGTVAQGQAAIVTAMNRVNGIYERDVAIRMVLVANNDQLVHTNGSTDPYSNNSGSTMLGQNQSNIDAVIGNANYDIGHVFSTGGGGIASLRVPCRSGSKARGVTGLGSPTGDPFWVDYVAHESGHQWGGNHTFNGSSGSCSGGNRNGSTAYEPGSGTTIQAYAGICSPQNVQNNSDDYFHGISLDEMIAYSTTGSGNNCAQQSPTGNNPPTVNAGAAYTIPLDTPFELCGSASDPNGDALTFTWEQFDLGPAGSPNSPSGNAPIFRSFSPTSSPCRTFPQASDLLSNTQTLGEILPSYARTMNFRLTARDNRSGGGGVADDATTVTASSVGGPFRVTSPNTAVTWTGGTTQTVTWNVAGTDQSPISCSSVDILLSADGGQTYATTLAAGVPNDGSQAITVTGPATSSARLQVRCTGNIFFDISNADFTVTASTGNPPTVSITAPADGSTADLGTSVTFSGTASDVEDGDLSGSLSWTSSIDGSIGSGASFSTSTLSAGNHTITASATDSDSQSGFDSIGLSIVDPNNNGPQTAVYDPALGAPKCAVAGSSCDSGTLLDSRNNLSPAEPNQPNTLDACTDGTSGSYHSDESNDRILITNSSGGNFAPGDTVEIAATVWAWNTGSQDSLDLYTTADANNPSWTFLITLVPSAGGAQTLTATYTLP